MREDAGVEGYLCGDAAKLMEDTTHNGFDRCTAHSAQTSPCERCVVIRNVTSGCPPHNPLQLPLITNMLPKHIRIQRVVHQLGQIPHLAFCSSNAHTRRTDALQPHHEIGLQHSSPHESKTGIVPICLRTFPIGRMREYPLCNIGRELKRTEMRVEVGNR